MHMTTSSRQVGGVTIVDISGRIQLGEESAALRDLVSDLLRKGHKKILFNLADVNYIDMKLRLGQSGRSAFTSVQEAEKRELKLLNLTTKLSGSRCDASYKARYRFRHHGRRGGGR